MSNLSSHGLPEVEAIETIGQAVTDLVVLC